MVRMTSSACKRDACHECGGCTGCRCHDGGMPEGFKAEVLRLAAAARARNASERPAAGAPEPESPGSGVPGPLNPAERRTAPPEGDL